MPPWATPGAYHSGALLNGSSPAAGATLAMRPATFTQVPDSGPQLTTSAASPLTVIALREGAAFLAQQYWIQNGQLHCVSTAGEEKLLPLDQLDLGQTVRLNQERNVAFALKSREVAEQ